VSFFLALTAVNLSALLHCVFVVQEQKSRGGWDEGCKELFYSCSKWTEEANLQRI